MPLSRFDLAVLSVISTPVKETWDEKRFNAERAEALARQTYAQRALAGTPVTVPTLHTDSLAFEPVLLKSALFRVGTGTRADHPVWSMVHTHGAHQIEFMGEELRQDDARVLLVLLKSRSGLVLNGVIELVPRTFCREALQWPDSSDSSLKLRASLERLKGAQVRVTYANGSLGLYSFVADVDLRKNDTWLVWLSPRLAAMFDRSLTYMSSTERLRLGDSLTSWMYQFIKADACFAPFMLPRLREQAGQTHYEQKKFNQRLRVVLRNLMTAGVIENFETKGKKLTIRKGKR